MKNLKMIYLLFLLCGILQANLKINTFSKNQRKNALSKNKNLTNKDKKKYMSRVLKLYKNGEKNYRKLNLKMKKDPKFLENKSRSLLFGDMSGGELMGLLGGVGGIYQMKKGNDEYNESISRLKQQSKYQNMQLMMKLNQRRNLIVQMDSYIKEMEDRIDDLGDQVSAKIQQYESAIHS